MASYTMAYQHFCTELPHILMSKKWADSRDNVLYLTSVSLFVGCQWSSHSEVAWGIGIAGCRRQRTELHNSDLSTLCVERNFTFIF